MLYERGTAGLASVYPGGGVLSILLSMNVSSSEMPISTSYAATLDPRHRVLGAWGRHGLWQGRGGLTSLVGIVSNQTGPRMAQARQALSWEPDCGRQSIGTAFGRKGEAARVQGTEGEQAANIETCSQSPDQP